MPQPSFMPPRAWGHRYSVSSSLRTVNLAGALLTCFSALLPWFSIAVYYFDDFGATEVKASLVQVSTDPYAVQFNANVEATLFMGLAVVVVITGLLALRLRRWQGIQFFLLVPLGLQWLYLFSTLAQNRFAWNTPRDDGAWPEIGMGVALVGILLTLSTNIALQIVLAGRARASDAPAAAPLPLH